MTLVYLGEVLGHVFIMYSALHQIDKYIHTYTVCVKFMFVCHLRNKTLKKVLYIPFV